MRQLALAWRRLSAGLRRQPGSLWAGLLSALAFVVLLVASLAYERQGELRDAGARAELLARVLEDHASRSIDTVAVSLAALGETMLADSSGRDFGQALGQTLAGLPLLRSVAVLDTQGRVLASTTPGDVGRRIDPARLGPLPAAGRDTLGPFVQGRSLSVLEPGAPPDTPRGVGFVPLVRHVEGRGRSVLVVGLVNPDAMANHQEQTVQGLRTRALLATLDGTLLAATSDVPLPPGTRLPPLPVLQRYLPRIEHDHYIGAGVGRGDQVVAFRAARMRPLVVLVEQSLSDALADWRDLARLMAVVGLATLGVVTLMTVAAERSRRGRELAQALVAAREHEMSIIVSSVQELIFRTDAAGRLLFVNPYWRQLSPLAPDQVLGRPLAELVNERSYAVVQSLFVEERVPGQRRGQLAIGQGEQLRQFECSVTPLHEGGRLVGFAGSAVDITERLAGQARLREQLAFTELLLEMLPLPVSMLDPEGRYLMVNQAWESIMGRRRVDVLGTRARQYLPPNEAAQHDEVDRVLLRDGGHASYEASVKVQSGRRDLAVTKAAVRGPDGQPAGVLVAFLDVTEARSAERAVREARDVAEEASRAKSEFIANISHELRTPLQSIIGFSELGETRGTGAPKLAAMFSAINSAGQRMLALVNDLLDVSKIESAVGTFQLERTDLRPLVRAVLRELQPLLDQRRLHVKEDLGDLPLVAKVDPMRFQQVVRNVMANAIRFSPDGATLHVDGELGDDQQLHLRLRDHGPGIPEGELESIFEAFVQSSRTKDGSGGTGLGLAICRKIVEAHGGRITAEHAPGGGSLFHIVLPARGFAETQPGGSLS